MPRGIDLVVIGCCRVETTSGALKANLGGGAAGYRDVCTDGWMGTTTTTTTTKMAMMRFLK
jgi:hypothetical protein